MKIGILLSFSILLLFTQCKNEFEVNDDWQDITVIYGLLDQADDTNYIRVTKGFLGDEDAYVMAQIADSLYYKNVDVFLEEWNGATLNNTYTLKDKTYIRNDGIFADSSIIFYTTAYLSSNYKYKLKVLEGGKEVTGQTSLLEDFNVTTLPPKVSLYNDQAGLTLEWYTKPNQKIFNVKMKFYYYEVYNDNTEKKDSIEITLPEKTASSITGDEKITTTLLGTSFLTYVGNMIKDDPNVNHRIVADSCFSFSFLVGTEELYMYMQVNQPATGIVTEKPIYTNINNGIGLFSSRYHKKLPYKRQPSVQTVNTLSTSSYTQHLKFFDYNHTVNIWIYYP